jgi:tetratricopeptide (TPR) repeat protein
MTARLVAIAAVLAVVAALTLGAAPAQADSDARAQAAAHVRQGQAFFERRDFDRALAEYQAALDLSGEPSLVFNIALCHDRANRPESALEAFQHYLELAPSGSVAEEARADVARLTPIVEKIRADRAVQDARQREAAAQRAEAARREEAARAETAARRIRLSWYLIGAGVIGAAGGGAVDVLSARAHDRLGSDVDRDGPPYAADYHTFVVQRDVAIGLYAAGGLTLAAGLVLALTAHRHGDSPQLSATITPGGAAMTIAWSR